MSDGFKLVAVELEIATPRWGWGGAGATFDWTFFDNSKVINFDD